MEFSAGNRTTIVHMVTFLGQVLSCYFAQNATSPYEVCNIEICAVAI